MKESSVLVIAITAIVTCCILSLFIMGGAISILGAYFKNNLWIIVGVIILIILGLINLKKKK